MCEAHAQGQSRANDPNNPVTGYRRLLSDAKAHPEAQVKHTTVFVQEPNMTETAYHVQLVRRPGSQIDAFIEWHDPWGVGHQVVLPAQVTERIGVLVKVTAKEARRAAARRNADPQAFRRRKAADRLEPGDSMGPEDDATA